MENLTAARIRLDISFAQPPEAREAGLIIERLGHAFTQWLSHNRSYKGSLQLTELRIGSLHGVFAFGDAVSSAVEHYNDVKGFLSDIAIGITTLQDANGGVVPASIRALISALVSPIVRQKADDARLAVEGDNNVVIIINRAEASVLGQILREIEVGARIEPSTPIRIRSRKNPVKSIEKLSQAKLEDRSRDALLTHQSGVWSALPTRLTGGHLPVVWEGFRPMNLDESLQYIATGNLLVLDNIPVGFMPATVKPVTRKTSPAN